MKFLNVFAWLALVGSIASVQAQSNSPQTAITISGGAAERPFLKFKVKSGATRDPEGGVVATTEMLVDHSKISFITPLGCTSSIKEEKQQVSFSAIPNPSSTVQMAVTVRIADGFSLPEDAALAAYLQNIYKGAKIQPADVVITGIGGGRFCDIRRVSASRNLMVTRHTFVPYAGGCVEVVLTADAESFDSQRDVLMGILNSLKVEPRSLSE